MRILALPVALLAFAACETPSRSEADAVEAQQAQYLAGQPIPAFDWSLERDVAIQLYAARNEEVATHTVWRGDTSVIEGDCPSIGYPLPYDTSLTNPVVIERYYQHSASYGVVEQAEPNGLYSSKNSIATWIRCVYVDEVAGAQVVPVYVEGKVTAWPFPLDVDYTTGRVTPAGSPSVVIER